MRTTDSIIDFDEAYNWISKNFKSASKKKLKRNLDGTFDYDGSLYFNGEIKKDLDKLTRIEVKFNYVSGVFDCSNNKLVTLENTPRRVGVRLSCYSNNLITLKHAPNPEDIGGHPNIDYGSNIISKHFQCYDNLLTMEDSRYKISGKNPVFSKSSKELEDDNVKIAENFITKLQKSNRTKNIESKIYRSLKKYNPIVYEFVRLLVDFDLDYWIENVEKAEKHLDIIDL